MFDRSSDETTGHHIFLEPEDALRGELSQKIRDLAHAHDGSVFVPHVTLLARIEGEHVIERTQAFAHSLEPFTLTLGELGGEDEYFRAFYIRIKEDDALQRAHERALALFEMEDARPYLPHLSLLYGNLTEQERAALIRDTAYPSDVSFAVSRLHLYETHGKADQWRKIGEYPFGA